MNQIYRKVQDTVQFIRSRCSLQPQVGIVLGSGLGAFASEVQVEAEFAFEDLPHFAKPLVEGHKGRLLLGTIKSIPCAVLQGRIHFYEGHSMEQVVHPVRTLGSLGIKTLFLTNAAGGIGDELKAGNLMMIRDHINLLGTNPLIGPNVDEFGPRFPDMTDVYSPALRAQMRQAFAQENLTALEGVYAAATGPSYETPAEVRYLKLLGIDAIGMSTVPEAIAARHMGIEVAGLSCITNLAAGISKTPLSHDEVVQTGKAIEKVFASLLTRIIGQIS